MANIIPIDISGLLKQLNNTALQAKDPQLYQFLKQLVENLNNINKAGGAAIASASSSGSKIISSQGIPGLDGIDGQDGIFIPGINGLNGKDGIPGFGIDGLDGDSIFIPGPAGDTGPTGPTGPAGSASLAKIPLSELQIESWSSSPIQVIAAPGAGLIVVPLFAYVQIFVSSVYTSNPSIKFVYGTNATSLLSTSIATSLSVASDTLRGDIAASGLSFSDYSTFDPRNKAINLKGSADPTGGLTGVATGIVNMAYVTFDFN